MPFYVRNLKKGTWCEPPEAGVFKAKSDSLKNFGTQRNKLSVFECNGDRRSADRMAAAVAAGKDRLTEIEYVVFEDRAVAELGINVCRWPFQSARWRTSDLHVHGQQNCTPACSFVEASRSVRFLASDALRAAPAALPSGDGVDRLTS